jgi:NADH-quinone oxidoreductase subunit N
MIAETISASLYLSVPEIILAIGALVLLMVGVFAGDRSGRLVTGLAILTLLIAGFWILFVQGTGSAYGGAYLADGYARFMKITALVGSAIAMFMVMGEGGDEQLDRFEYPVLLLLATLGIVLMISAHDLISLYLSLELQSLALYVVCAINRESLRATEAGLKYFVLGALSSGMLLYGMSLVYGFTGHTSFDGIAAALAGGRSLGLIFGLVFIIAGLAFKVSAVPFHMWTPDVYEGAPTPVTAFLSGAPKVAAMALLVRIVTTAFHPVIGDWQQIIIFIAIASILLGSFAAVGQPNIKRLMAYSSIANMGYALVGLAGANPHGVSSVMMYMLIYMIMSLGSFACIMAMKLKDGTRVEKVSDLAGLSVTNPFMAFVLTIQMFSMAGIPPMAGFFAKYFVFTAAVEAKLYALAVVGLAGSVVGAYYYLRVVRVMWFDEATVEFARVPGTLRLVFGASCVFVLAYAFFGGALGTAADVAAATLF